MRIDVLTESDAVTGYGSGGIGLFTHGLVDTHFSNRGNCNIGMLSGC